MIKINSGLKELKFFWGISSDIRDVFFLSYQNHGSLFIILLNGVDEHFQETIH